MAQQTINIGASPNDGTGTPLRTAFQYTNSNFSELYTAVGPSGNNIVVPGNATITGNLTVDTNSLYVNSSTNNVGLGTLTPSGASGRALEIYGGAGQSRIALKNDTTGSASTDGSQIALVGSQLVIQNREASEITFETNNSERYRLASDGVATWSNVGGFAGTAMTLNATGLGVGTSPSYNIDVLGATLPTISVRSTLAGASNARLYLECAGANSGHITYNRSLQALTLGATGGTTAQVTLDSVGNVGIGVTPSAQTAGFRSLEINGKGNSLLSYSNDNVYLNENAYFNSSWKYGSTATAGQYTIFQGTHRWNIAPSGTIDTAITWTQAMTLNASGTLLVGLTTNTGTYSTPLVLSSNAGTVGWSNGPTAANPSNFYISGTGGNGVYLNGVAATSWTAISDERFKDIIEPISNAVAKVGLLRSVIGKFKTESEGTRRSFLIAQDVQAVLPEAVDASNPEKLGVSYTEVIPLLVAAIKELTARVQTLETR